MKTNVTGVQIVAVNADELPDLVRRMGDEYFHGPRIGVWGWETNVIPARWERAFGPSKTRSSRRSIHSAPYGCGSSAPSAAFGRPRQR